MIEANMQKKIDYLGSPSDAIPATEEQIQFAREHISNSYGCFMKEYGVGHYFNRGWQFCDPEEFRPLAALIFKADPDFSHNDCHIVGFSAFGDLIVWSEQHWIVNIHLLEYMIKCNRLYKSVSNIPLPAPKRPTVLVTAETVTRSLIPSEPDVGEFWDRDGREMFARCVKAHGPLEAGECFGFVPSLGMTGYNSKYRYVEHVQRLKALEHFCLIAQMKDFHLVRHNMGQKEQMRVIG